MKKTTVLIVSVFLLSLFFLPQTAYSETAGEATAQVLEMGAGAKFPAMGGAGQASVSGPAALTYNPAGLASPAQRELEFTYQKLVEDISYGNFDYIKPGAGLSWAGGLRYIDYGSEQQTDWSGGTGSELEEDGSFDGADVVASGGLAGKLTNNLSWGLTSRFIRLEIADEDATGLSLDAGLQWRSPSSRLPVALGATVQNFGTKLKFDQQEEDLPLLYSVGGSLFLKPLINQDIVLHTDFDYHEPDSESALRVGGEWRFYDQLFAARLGYDGGLDVDNGMTYGFGFDLSERNMSLDYSLAPYGDFGDLHRLTFNYYFDSQ